MATNGIEAAMTQELLLETEALTNLNVSNLQLPTWPPGGQSAEKSMTVDNRRGAQGIHIVYPPDFKVESIKAFFHWIPPPGQQCCSDLEQFSLRTHSNAETFGENNSYQQFMLPPSISYFSGGQGFELILLIFHTHKVCDNLDPHLWADLTAESPATWWPAMG